LEGSDNPKKNPEKHKPLKKGKKLFKRNGPTFRGARGGLKILPTLKEPAATIYVKEIKA